MIQLDAVRIDGNGFPIVSWVEQRNAFVPDGAGMVRVDCYIREDWITGELLFSVCGGFRAGEIQVGRPWRALEAFGAQGLAQQIFYTGSQSSGMRQLQDNARVIEATFADDRPSLPMYVNRADAGEAYIREVHSVLIAQFLRWRDDLVAENNAGQFVWPADKEWKGLEHALTFAHAVGADTPIQLFPADAFASDWLLSLDKKPSRSVFWQVELGGSLFRKARRFETGAASAFKLGRTWVFQVQIKAPDGSARTWQWRRARVGAFRHRASERKGNKFVVEVGIEGAGWQPFAELGTRKEADAKRLATALHQKFIEERAL